MLVLLRGRHCILAMSVFFWLLWIVSMMILLLLALTFCNSNPWIQFSGSKFKRFLFEICQRRSNPPWQGSCPGQEPTFPTTGPDVLLLLLLHNISPSKPPQKVFWSLTAQKKLTLGLKPIFPKQKWAKILWTGGGHKVEWAYGIMAHPPTPEFHFLLVFAGNSNYGEGYIEKVVIQKCQWTIHSGYIFGTFWPHIGYNMATFCRHVSYIL